MICLWKIWGFFLDEEKNHSLPANLLEDDLAHSAPAHWNRGLFYYTALKYQQLGLQPALSLKLYLSSQPPLPATKPLGISLKTRLRHPQVANSEAQKRSSQMRARCLLFTEDFSTGRRNTEEASVLVNMLKNPLTREDTGNVFFTLISSSVHYLTSPSLRNVDKTRDTYPSGQTHNCGVRF